MSAIRVCLDCGLETSFDDCSICGEPTMDRDEFNTSFRKALQRIMSAEFEPQDWRKLIFGDEK